MSGVIDIGSMTDVDGVPVTFSVNLDRTVRVTIHGYRPGPGIPHAAADLDADARREFVRLWCAAVRQAAPKRPLALLPGMRGTPEHALAAEGATEVILSRHPAMTPLAARHLAEAVAERIAGDLYDVARETA